MNVISDMASRQRAHPLESLEAVVAPRLVRRDHSALQRLDGRAPELSVVVPTRNEAEGIGLLLDALGSALAGIDAEVVFVDDSSDETPAAIEAQARKSTLPIRVHHRAEEARTGGLGGAVQLGFAEAQGRFVAVMDADLQHPPAVLPHMLLAATDEDADLVVGSRFGRGGSSGEFGLVRRALSRGSSTLAKLLFPGRLRRVTDPMSGFFLVRRERLAPEALRPHGFKILLEVLVRSAPLRVGEVPYTFGDRVAGESKASLREGVRYLRHLFRLRLAVTNTRPLKFGLVGISGLAVNMLLLAVLTSGAGLLYLASALLATEASIVWNFALSECWVFRRKGDRDGWLRRFVSFAVTNNTAFALSGPLLWLLVQVIGLQYLLANLVSICALMVARFLVADRLIWRPSPQPSPRAKVAWRHVARRVQALATAALG
jgi:dolichol-phosphate mannosyltransferase